MIGQLDAPPPSPLMPAMGQALAPGAAPVGAGVMGMGEQVERALLDLSRAFPQGANEFNAAIEFLKQGLAKAVQASVGPPPSVSPTNTGPQFPGGGFSSGMI